jgi:putative tricarboxylic transport membrane protein
MPTDATPEPRRSAVKAPTELVAGLFLLALSAVSLYGSLDLHAGELSRMGPGMMPMIASIAVGLFGLVLVGFSFLAEGPPLERWHLRSIFFVFGAVIVFAATIRGFGLAVSGPLAVVISSLADRDTRLVEIIPFAFVLTLVCALLFKWLLGLPIPLMPFLIDY